MVLLQKSDGSKRMCVNLRKVNAVTKKDVYPLPNIDDLLSALKDASYFTALDLNSGYWQIPVKPGDCEKLAFICSHGLFKFPRMPFGTVQWRIQFLTNNGHFAR